MGSHGILCKQLTSFFDILCLSQSEVDIKLIKEDSLSETFVWAKYFQDLYLKAKEYPELMTLLQSTFSYLHQSRKGQLNQEVICDVEGLEYASFYLLQAFVQNKAFPFHLLPLLQAKNKSIDVPLSSHVLMNCDQTIVEQRVSEHIQEFNQNLYLKDVCTNSNLSMDLSLALHEQLAHSLRKRLLAFALQKEGQLNKEFLENLKSVILSDPETLVVLLLALKPENGEKYNDENVSNLETFEKEFSSWVAHFLETNKFEHIACVPFPSSLSQCLKRIKLVVKLCGHYLPIAKLCLRHLLLLMEDESLPEVLKDIVVHYWSTLKKESCDLQWAVEGVLHEYFDQDYSVMKQFWRSVLNYEDSGIS